MCEPDLDISIEDITDNETVARCLDYLSGFLVAKDALNASDIAWHAAGRLRMAEARIKELEKREQARGSESPAQEP